MMMTIDLYRSLAVAIYFRYVPRFYSGWIIKARNAVPRYSYLRHYLCEVLP